MTAGYRVRGSGERSRTSWRESAGSAEEESELEGVNAWMEGYGLPAGIIAYEQVDDETERTTAIFDLVWPDGIQQELSDPVALLLDEETAVVSMASAAGYRCFTSVDGFQQYVRENFLQLSEEESKVLAD